jgi:hypothetical protein
MSTSLILRPTGQLTETQAAMLSEMDNEGLAGFDFKPLRIKLPAGGSTSAFMLSDGDMIKSPMDVIIAVAQRKRAFYPSKDPVSGQPPLCASPDGLVGLFDGESALVQSALTYPIRHPALSVLDPTRIAGPWQCASCPLSEWGTAGDGSRGQSCKEKRALLVIVRGWAMPAVLSLPATSVKVWDAFASGLWQRGRAYFSLWLSLELQKEKSNKGTDYSVLVIKSGAALTDPEAAEVMAIRAQYAELVRTMNLDGDDYVDAVATAAPHDEEEEELNPF